MKFAFDLWSYDDVRTHAAEILERVRGSVEAFAKSCPVPVKIFLTGARGF